MILRQRDRDIYIYMYIYLYIYSTLSHFRSIYLTFSRSLYTSLLLSCYLSHTLVPLSHFFLSNTHCLFFGVSLSHILSICGPTLLYSCLSLPLYLSLSHFLFSLSQTLSLSFPHTYF